MKIYFKKFSIMFVMLLAIVGVGVFQDGIMANAVTIGQQLTQPEDGWKRYDDSTSLIKYTGNWTVDSENSLNNFTNKEVRVTSDNTATIRFKFKGTEFRYLGYCQNDSIRAMDNEVYIDGMKQLNTLSFNVSNITISTAPTILYEVIGLSNSVHEVNIKMIGANKNLKYANIDGIDTDGELINTDKSISLDKSTMNLNVGDSQQLTATTTPAGAQITWISDNTGVATVDPTTGKVTGVKEGTCTITATTADGLTAKCVVTVTKENDPQPQPTTGDANLYIELVDGQIKQYTVPQDEINKFTSWFENRDKDHSLTATYKFTKGTYKDYVVHDQIDWFEVR
jgi:uncharacterized protein YjdB